MKHKSMQELKSIVREFNREYPVGTSVFLRKDGGEIQTKVRGSAIVLHGHSAVAWFDNVSGAYSIESDRVRPAPLPLADLTSMNFEDLVP